jgi:hypothetical protein
VKVGSHATLCVEVSGRRVLECGCQVCVVWHGREAIDLGGAGPLPPPQICGVQLPAEL